MHKSSLVATCPQDEHVLFNSISEFQGFLVFGQTIIGKRTVWTRLPILPGPGHVFLVPSHPHNTTYLCSGPKRSFQVSKPSDFWDASFPQKTFVNKGAGLKRRPRSRSWAFRRRWATGTLWVWPEMATWRPSSAGDSGKRAEAAGGGVGAPSLRCF